VKETIKTVTDSRSGVKKMQVGRQLGDKGHIVEREENLYTGQREENEELLNMDFEDKDVFDREWRNMSHGRRRGVASAPIVDQPSITYGEETGSTSNYRSSSGHSNGRAATYTPTVTIEELSDEEAAPSVPTGSHIPTSSSSRKSKDRRQKSYSSKRAKKY